jgi:hypothetical protein
VITPWHVVFRTQWIPDERWTDIASQVEQLGAEAPPSVLVDAPALRPFSRIPRALSGSCEERRVVARQRTSRILKGSETIVPPSGQGLAKPQVNLLIGVSDPYTVSTHTP